MRGAGETRREARRETRREARREARPQAWRARRRPGERQTPSPRQASLSRPPLHVEQEEREPVCRNSGNGWPQEILLREAQGGAMGAAREGAGGVRGGGRRGGGRRGGGRRAAGAPHPAPRAVNSAIAAAIRAMPRRSLAALCAAKVSRMASASGSPA